MQLLREAFSQVSKEPVKTVKEEGRKQEYVGDFKIEEAVKKIIGEKQYDETDELKSKCKEMLDNPDMVEAEEFLKGCMEMKSIDEKAAMKIEKLYELCKKK